jgi:hypothetical protein
VVGVNPNYFSHNDFLEKSSGHVNFFWSVDFSEWMILAMQKALKLSNRYIWECPLQGIPRATKSMSDNFIELLKLDLLRALILAIH